ncbi:4'-phosphopantetheinyl transferase family protein [Lysobacter humi (ex Lee et al. 2017)]
MQESALPFPFGPVEAGLLPRPSGAAAEPLARAWLAPRLGAAPADLPLRRDAHGRPRLGLAGRDCNWSHSGGHLLVALGRGVDVGVDVEVARPRPKALELAQRYFHPAEAAELAGLAEADRSAAFLRLWCAKEALLKAHGRGLAFGLDRLRFAGFAETTPVLVEADPALGPVGGWRLEGLDVPGAVAVIAWRTPAG